MAHPAASIKSIVSGKMNFDSPEDPFSPEITVDDSSSYTYDLMTLSEPQRVGNKKIFKHQKAPQNVTAKNLRALSYSLGNPKFEDTLYCHSSDTNVSVALTGSAYQQSYDTASSPTDNWDTTERAEYTNSMQVAYDTGSCNISRTSTMLCLSTTATKDGIEGKRLHRLGPTPYSNSIITGMIQHNAQIVNQSHAANENTNPPHCTTLLNTFASISNSPGLPDEHDNNSLGKLSAKSTYAEYDGEVGEKDRFDIERYSNLAPVTLSEKINLLQTEHIQSET